MGRKDAGWCWFVLLGTSCLMFVETGVVKGLGVLLPSIREQMVTQTWVVGLSISLTPGFGSLVCVLAGAMSKIVQPRLTIMMCALLTSVGLLVMSFASNVYIMMFAMLVTGFTTGTTAVSSAIIPQYFDKYYDSAVTMYSCGLSMGMVVMPILTQWLLDLYGWRGTILLLCGVSLQGIVCSALLRPNRSVVVKKTLKIRNINDFFIHIGTYLDIDLLSNMSLLAMMSIYAGDGFATTGWLIYVVPHVLDIGFTSYESAMVAVVGGVAHVAGNILYPVLLKWMSFKVQVYISIILMASSFALDVLASHYSSYMGLMACSVVFGLGAGLNKTASLPAVKDVVNEDKLVNAMGLAYAGYSLASIASGFACGWLYDYSGSYAISFLVLSVVCVATAVPLCVDDIRISEYNKGKGAPI